MRNLIKKTTMLAGATMLSMSASAYDNVYFFGDSLSDAGQFTAAIGTLPPGIEAKFTNIDPLQGNIIAADVIANAFGFTSVDSGLVEGLSQGVLQDIGNNYAVGGAVAIDEDDNELTPDFNLPTQINSHLASRNGQAEPNALYTIIIGGNDLFAAQQIRAAYVPTAPGAERQAIRKASKARVDQAVDAVKGQLLKLIGSGASNVLVGNAPDISAVPATDALVAQLLAGATDANQERRAMQMYELSSDLTGRFNRKLSKAIKEVEQLTGVDIIEYDVEEFLNRQIDDADELGYTNTTDACLPQTPGLGACEGFVFADGVHPTTAVHQAIGVELVQVLLQNQ